MGAHKDTGFRCLVAHVDGDGEIQPPCWKCSCGEWVKFGSVHPSPSETPQQTKKQVERK